MMVVQKDYNGAEKLLLPSDPSDIRAIVML